MFGNRARFICPKTLDTFGMQFYNHAQFLQLYGTFRGDVALMGQTVEVLLCNILHCDVTVPRNFPTGSERLYKRINYSHCFSVYVYINSLHTRQMQKESQQPQTVSQRRLLDVGHLFYVEAHRKAIRTPQERSGGFLVLKSPEIKVEQVKVLQWNIFEFINIGQFYKSKLHSVKANM